MQFLVLKARHPNTLCISLMLELQFFYEGLGRGAGVIYVTSHILCRSSHNIPYFSACAISPQEEKNGGMCRKADPYRASALHVRGGWIYMLYSR